jgi:hypothetical protein
MIPSVEDHAQSLAQSIAGKIDGFFYRCLNDKDFTMVHLSSGFKPLLGYDADWFIATRQSFAGLTHPDDIARVDAAVATGLTEKRNWRIAYRLRDKNGVYKQVFETGGGYVSPETGQLAYLDGVILDAHQEAAQSSSGSRTQVAREIGVATGEILKTLKTLRLLALNARLEAVRAGEHGLGFSIVAREMVDLAAHSDTSARAIERLIARLEDDTLAIAS